MEKRKDTKDFKKSLYKEHNEFYLRECLYNLEEKAMRNIVDIKEWRKVYNKFKNFTNLWCES